MKYGRFAFWTFGIACGAIAGVLAQDPPPQQPPPQQEQAPPPEPMPRVVGQTRSQEEWLAWKAVVDAPDAGQTELAKQFLQDYPDSGMTPHAHWIIARHSFGSGDYASFTMHGEATVKEIPAALGLLAQLAFYYAETRQFDSSIHHAENLLKQIDSLQNTNNLPPAQFANTRDQVAGQGNYALGRSYLGKLEAHPEAGAEDPLLGQAVDCLEKALAYNPADDYAYFRLGEAYQIRNDPEEAGLNYALAAAVGGAVAGPARQNLEALFEAMHKDAGKIDALIEQQRGVLQTRLQAKQQEYQNASAPPPQPPR